MGCGAGRRHVHGLGLRKLAGELNCRGALDERGGHRILDSASGFGLFMECSHARTRLRMLIETLGEAWSLGWRVHIRCAKPMHDRMKSTRECVFRCELDMETLVCTRGRAFPLARLSERL